MNFIAATLLLAVATSSQADTALRSPPANGAPSNLRFDRAASPEENASRRATLQQRVEELATAAKRAALAQRPKAEGAPEALTPPSSPADAAQIAKELESWKRALDQFQLESICGPLDDSVDVERYTGNLGPTKEFVARHQPAVMQLQWRKDLPALLGSGGNAGDVTGVRWCTGTMVGENIMLTAGHCFDIDSNNWTTPRRNGVALTPAELAPLFQLNFDYQYPPVGTSTRPEVVYPVIRLLEHRLGTNLDFAFVEVGRGADGRFPSARFGQARMDASDAGLTGAMNLTVIQHPAGNPKKVAAGQGVSIKPPFLQYTDVDTLGGSSGSGVLDQRGVLVAVHTNGGCTQDGGRNSGLSLKAIKPVSATLQKLAP